MSLFFPSRILTISQSVTSYKTSIKHIRIAQSALIHLQLIAMNFPFSDCPQTQTPPSPTAYRNQPHSQVPSSLALSSPTPFISQHGLASLEHQFLYYPSEQQSDSLTYDASAASNANTSVDTPASGSQQPLPLILSTPPSSLAQGTFNLGPAFREVVGSGGNWQPAMPNTNLMPTGPLSEDFIKHRAVHDSSPFGESIPLTSIVCSIRF